MLYCSLRMDTPPPSPPGRTHQHPTCTYVGKQDGGVGARREACEPSQAKQSRACAGGSQRHVFMCDSACEAAQHAHRTWFPPHAHMASARFLVCEGVARAPLPPSPPRCAHSTAPACLAWGPVPRQPPLHLAGRSCCSSPQSGLSSRHCCPLARRPPQHDAAAPAQGSGLRRPAAGGGALVPDHGCRMDHLARTLIAATALYAVSVLVFRGDVRGCGLGARQG